MSTSPRPASLAGVALIATGIAAIAAAGYFFLGSTNGTYRETVTITTDDPRVTITAVAPYGKPIQAQGLGTPQARFTIDADEDGIPCDTDDLEIHTSNNVTHYPQVNLCEAHWQIKLATAVEPVPPGVHPEPQLRWIMAAGQDTQFPTQLLHYAVPETDGTLLSASCQPRSGRITTRFTGDTKSLESAKTARIDFYTQAGVLRYDATVAKIEEAGAEETMPFSIEQPATNPLWAALASGAQVPFRIHTADVLILDASHGAADISKFVATCQAH